MNEIKKWLESEDKNYEAGLMLLAKYGRNRILLSNLSKRETKHFRDKLEYELRKIAGITSGRNSPNEKDNETGLKAMVPFIVIHNDDGTYTASAVEHHIYTDGKDLEELTENMFDAGKCHLEKDIIPEIKFIETGKKLNFNELPENLQKVYTENMDAYAEIKALHAKMCILPSGDENNLARKQIAETICFLDDKISGNWKLIDESLAGIKNIPANPVMDKKPKNKSEIDAMPDGEEKFNAKALRIKSNRTWIGRNFPKIETSEGDAKAKLQAEYEIRLKELEEWGEKI